MKLEQFLRERSGAWKELEGYVSRFDLRDERALDGNELTDMGDLYREVTGDLSYLSTYYPEAPETAYLNRLVGMAHARLYYIPPKRLSRLWQFFACDFPMTLRKNILPVGLAFMVFMISAIIGFFVCIYDRESTEAFLPMPDFLTYAEHRLKDSDNWFKMDEDEKPVISSFIMTNNIQVAILAFALGVTFGVGTFLSLIFNGFFLGALTALFTSFGRGLDILSQVTIHGVPELFAIFIAGGAGFMMGYALINPGDLTRGESLRRAGKEALVLMIGLIPILVVAGLVEAFITPLHMKPGMNFTVAALIGILLFIYIRQGWASDKKRKTYGKPDEACEN
ncbi:MAG: stage II sporulation protein M [Chloroflexi bacterium]|nr:stage II sporulation protein M [Chloroflexota bacterium]